MSSFIKQVVLPCTLLVAAILSLWHFVDWSGPRTTAEDEERELAERCAIVEENKLPDESMPSECLELDERIRAREAEAFLDRECPKIGGWRLGTRLCVRTGEGGFQEYTDGLPASWHDCLDHFERETDDTDCGWPGQPDCIVHPPFWCPELRGFRDADGKVHLD